MTGNQLETGCVIPTHTIQPGSLSEILKIPTLVLESTMAHTEDLGSVPSTCMAANNCL